MEKHSISVRIPGETYRDLSVYAGEQMTSLNNVIVAAIEAWWSQQPEKAKYAKRREAEQGEVATPVASEQSTPKKESEQSSQLKAPKTGAKKKS
jgi:hypothetical protein